MVGVIYLPTTWVLYGINVLDIGHWFYTSKPAKGRDQSQQTSQEVSHWFLSLGLLFWRINASHRFLSFEVVPWVSSLLAHRSQPSQSSQQPMKTSVNRGKMILWHYGKPPPRVGHYLALWLGCPDCSAPVGWPIGEIPVPWVSLWSVCWWTLTPLNVQVNLITIETKGSGLAEILAFLPLVNSELTAETHLFFLSLLLVLSFFGFSMEFHFLAAVSLGFYRFTLISSLSLVLSLTLLLPLPPPHYSFFLLLLLVSFL